MPERRRDGRAPANRPPGSSVRIKWARSLLIILVGAVALWLTLAVTFGGIVHASQAGRIVRWSPFDARIRSAAAATLLVQAREPRVAESAARLAEDALRRDPTNVVAVRTLALTRLLANRAEEARRLFRYSQSLSRRDLGTQLALIEVRVQADDVDGALRHFDIALRTSAAAGPILYPVLVSASEEDHIARRLRVLLEANPPWRQHFFEPLVHNARSPDTIVKLMAGLLHVEDPADRFLAQAAFSRLLRERHVDQAWALYESMKGRGSGGRIRNGDFQQAADLPPVDWSLASAPALAGLRQLRPGSSDDAVLVVFSGEGQSGEVARQLVRLGPGRYRFAAETGNVASTGPQPSVRLDCVNGGTLFRQSFGDLRRGVRFAVPASGCANQWIIVEAAASAASEASVPWIDDLAVERLP